MTRCPQESCWQESLAHSAPKGTDPSSHLRDGREGEGRLPTGLLMADRFGPMKRHEEMAELEILRGLTVDSAKAIHEILGRTFAGTHVNDGAETFVNDYADAGEGDAYTGGRVLGSATHQGEKAQQTPTRLTNTNICGDQHHHNHNKIPSTTAQALHRAKPKWFSRR